MNTDTRNNLSSLDIETLNRWAWRNDYPFCHNGLRISPKEGTYLNGWQVEKN